MKVRAKFRCVEKKNLLHYDKPHAVVKLSAVCDEANKSWSKWTPSGTVEMMIDNPDAYEAFQLGEFYFLDFTIAPATEAEEKPKA